MGVLEISVGRIDERRRELREFFNVPRMIRHASESRCSIRVNAPPYPYTEKLAFPLRDFWRERSDNNVRTVFSLQKTRYDNVGVEEQLPPPPSPPQLKEAAQLDGVPRPNSVDRILHPDGTQHIGHEALNKVSVISTCTECLKPFCRTEL